MICDAGGGTVVCVVYIFFLLLLLISYCGVTGRPKGPGVLQDYRTSGPEWESRDRGDVCPVWGELWLSLSGSPIPGARQDAAGRSPCPPRCGELGVFHAFVQSDGQAGV